VLEYSGRAGGRCWSLRGGDRYVELDGAVQECRFDTGLYFNPGPWRIPFHHRGLLDYCKRFRVALEPFIQVNYNAYLHATNAFGGRPQRYRHVQADFTGYIAELLAKATNQSKLDDAITASVDATHQPSAASAVGAMMLGACIAATSVQSTAVWCWRASMSRTSRPGRRGQSCPRSTRSSGCIAVCWRVD
jgi:monoamine oxidase